MLICTPLVFDYEGWDVSRPVVENRTMAPAPSQPGTLDELIRFPAASSAFIADNYSLRNFIVRLDGRLRYNLFSEFLSDDVALGSGNRLFLDSTIDLICGVGWNANRTADVANGLARVFDQTMLAARQVYYLSIPTSPVINQDELPAWLRQRCGIDGVFVPRLQRELARQRPDLADRLVYPKDTLLGVKTSGAPFPKWFFHWSGTGSRAVVEAFSEHVLGLSRHVTVPDSDRYELSDLAQFTPGIERHELVPIPDHAAAGIDFCWGGGGACDPAFRRFASKIGEISRARWTTGSGPALLIISDSFGRKAAEYFSEYYADLLHLNLNYPQLHPGDLDDIAAQIFQVMKPDAILFIFQDASAVHSPFLIATAEALARAARK